MLNRPRIGERSKEGESRNLISPRLAHNRRHIEAVLGGSRDVVVRLLEIGGPQGRTVAVFYTDGLTDTGALQQFVIEPLLRDGAKLQPTQNEDPGYIWMERLAAEVLTVCDLSPIGAFDELFPALLGGDAVLLADGQSTGLMIGLEGAKDRAVADTSTEGVIRGPKEGFTENIRTSTALIRRKLRSEQLRLESYRIGRVSGTDTALMFIHGIADDSVVDEVRDRLGRIDIDGILESGYIEEFIQDRTLTPFPTIYSTDRPDVVAAGLLEGRVAIIVDGTPFVLLVPALFTEFYQAAEDYYQRADIATLLRLLRLVSLFISLLGPSMYIAITTFHQEMLPTSLLLSLSAQREGVPFPAFVEAIIMEISFEIIREASIRMPRAIGQSISIVGTLVVGTAAVEAGIVSAAMVIVVSITAISGFVIPTYSMSISIRMLRFVFMGLAASFGLFGILVGLLGLAIHLCSLSSFGVPYMEPLAPFNAEGQRDTLVRLPRWLMNIRPRSIARGNLTREQSER